MPDEALDTRALHAWFARMHLNDAAAREELLRAVCGRLERLARSMLRGFPNVPRRLADTDDVFQGAAVRLARSLETMDPPPASVQAFFAFAASCIRGELLDLARRFGRQRREGDRDALPLGGDSSVGGIEVVDTGESPESLDRWRRFHEEVDRLSGEEREVVGLKFYHGWSEEQIAELLGVSVRTVRRWWASAGAKLAEALGGAMPQA